MAGVEASAENQVNKFSTLIVQWKDKLCDNDYLRMKASITASASKGRPLKLQPQKLTNKLLLQLELLRTECKKSWEEILNFVPKIVKTEQPSLQGMNLKTEIEAVVREGTALSDEQQIEDFLSVDVDKCMMLRNIGPFLAKHSFYRHHLLNPETLTTQTPPSDVCNGMVYDLVMFLRAECIPLSGQKSRDILHFLGVSVADVTDKQLLSKFKKVTDRYQQLNKNTHREKGQLDMNKFLESAFSTLSKQTSQREPGSAEVNFPTEAGLKLSASEQRSATLRRQLEDLRLRLEEEQRKTVVLSEHIQESDSRVTQLENQVCEARQEKTRLEDENRKLKANIVQNEQQLRQMKQTLRQIRQANYYKRLQRKERWLKQKEAVLQTHMVGNCEKKQRQLKRKIKLLQTQVSNQKTRLQTVTDKSKLQIARLQQQTVDLLNHRGSITINTRKENSNEYTEEIKKTTIALIAAQVSTQNCPRVIRTVSQYLFNARIDEKDLPSERTVRRYSDMGHVLAKAQVAEAMDSQNFDLHVDGTSREKKKYVGQQVTTADGSLSCGFSILASENASSLVDTSVSLLQELSDLFHDSPQERDAHFKRMCRNLKGIMSDRAAVMKKYKRDMNDLIQATLATEESVEFLYCNAHFLLGLSSAANTSFKATQMEFQQERIGRDKHQQFSKFFTQEAAAVRYIRMACEVLGPRGDEKNGCRDSWIAYCSLHNKQSAITSFKANRFNNLFQAAAALHFHRGDIIQFLNDYLPDRNSKLTSVLYDAQSDDVAEYVLCLALVFLRVTGPYWLLLGGRIHYLDFHVYVVEMRTQLDEWQNDASTIFEDIPGLFGKPLPNDVILQAALSVPNVMGRKVSTIFQKLASSFLSVINAQLSDFLPGGTYHGVTDGALREKLSHSVITNLVGEACFGDLDLSIYKRRNASCHHHTSVTMMMRNKMMEKWFSLKPADDQSQLLQLSAKKAGPLRQKHRQEEKDAIAQRRLELQANKQRQEDKNAALARKKDDIIRKLMQHGGPCRTPEDVEKLLRGQTTTQKRQALRVEMNYHKVVLGVKCALLQTTRPVDTLAANLKEFLQQRPQAVPAHIHDNVADNTRGDQDAVPPAMEATADNVQHQLGPASALSAESFDSLKNGDMVAIYYDDDFYIGCLHEVKDSHSATVDFMKKCCVSNKTYVWPKPQQREQISWCYVFEAGFQIETRNGRIWHIPDNVNMELEEKYQAYKEEYCQ